MKNKPIIEICANSVESAVEAQRGGAQRVELCAGIPEGGTTPSYGDIVMSSRLLDIKLNVIIRPRGGDFLYSPLELDIMQHDIEICRELGADGVVFGCLTPEGEVDKPTCKRLIAAAGDMSLTFHRAFDMCANPRKALEDIIDLGFDRVLTSGCEATALQGKALIRELVQLAGDRIIIMPGCGIKEDNIKEILAFTEVAECHMSLRERVGSGMIYRNATPSMGGSVVIDEFSKDVTSAERIKSILKN